MYTCTNWPLYNLVPRFSIILNGECNTEELGIGPGNEANLLLMVHSAALALPKSINTNSSPPSVSNKFPGCTNERMTQYLYQSYDSVLAIFSTQCIK